MKKDFKIIFGLLIIVLILTIILTLKIINPKKDDFVRLTPDKIKEKMLSAEEITNFTLQTKNSDGSTITKKRKDNIFVITDSLSGTYGWGDKDTEICVAGNTKTGKYVQTNYDSLDIFSNHLLHIKANLKSYGDNLYHIRNEQYKGKTCMVIQAGENKKESYWVDIDTGFVLKYIGVYNNGLDIREYDVVLNNVKDSDIKKMEPTS